MRLGGKFVSVRCHTGCPDKAAIYLNIGLQARTLVDTKIMFEHYHPSARRPMSSSRSQHGFTLIELMVTMGLLIILMTLAAPSFQQTIASTRLTTATNDLYTSLAQARSDAIRQGQRMTVCKSSDGTSCDTGTTTWSIGWITVVDTTRTAATPSVDTGETVSYVAQAVDPSVVIQGNGNMANYVSFGADGQSKTINGGFLAGTIRVCSTSAALSDDTRARHITINIAGRTAITKPTGVGVACNAPP
jgi:type IV fimbrial biogenesis protein FimT